MYIHTFYTELLLLPEVSQAALLCPRIAQAAMWRSSSIAKPTAPSAAPLSPLCTCWGDPSPPQYCFLYYLCPAVVYKLFKSFLGTDRDRSYPESKNADSLKCG